MASRKNRRLLVWRLHSSGTVRLAFEEKVSQEDVTKYVQGIAAVTRLFPDLYLEKGEDSKSATVDTPSGTLLLYVERAT